MQGVLCVSMYTYIVVNMHHIVGCDEYCYWSVFLTAERLDAAVTEFTMCTLMLCILTCAKALHI